VDQAEAERTGERLRRAFLAKAQRGDVNNGQRPFGWAEDKKALHPKEARLLRKAIEDVIDGVPMYEIARRWNKAGVTTTRGKAWYHTAVRQVLRNPRLAGWRTHQKAIARDAIGQRVKGVWTPMVDQDTFDALQAALDGRGHKRRRGAQKYLLSGTARCGLCGARMHGYRTQQGTHAYACGVEGQDHTVTIAGRQTDDLLTLLIAERLRTVDLSGETIEAPAWEGEARLAAIRGQIAGLMTAFREGVLSGAIVFPQVQALEAEQAHLKPLVRLLRPGPSSRARTPSRPSTSTGSARWWTRWSRPWWWPRRPTAGLGGRRTGWRSSGACEVVTTRPPATGDRVRGLVLSVHDHRGDPEPAGRSSRSANQSFGSVIPAGSSSGELGDHPAHGRHPLRRSASSSSSDGRAWWSRGTLGSSVIST